MRLVLQGTVFIFEAFIFGEGEGGFGGAEVGLMFAGVFPGDG